MHSTLSPFQNRRRRTRLLAACFTIAGSLIFLNTAARVRSPQEINRVKISVEDPRPVSKAIRTLEWKYKWVITYEDPRYLHESEIMDVTSEVRKDLDLYKPGEAPKVLVPKKGALEFSYDAATNPNLPPDSAVVVQNLLDAQTARGIGGQFRLEKSGKVLHVIPTSIKNSAGELVVQESILDTLISLPAEERTVDETLHAICEALSYSTGIRVGIGASPSWFGRYKYKPAPGWQKARDLLVEMFAALEHGGDLSWELNYTPDLKWYMLNLHHVTLLDGKW
jgi:hypothetical protein